MLTSIVVTAVWGWLIATLTQFWAWIAAGCIAILTLLFSPTLRKYTIGVIAASILLTMAYLYGYNSNHKVEIQQHQCSEFSKLLRGPSDEIAKIIGVFERKGLCVDA